jgi:streptogramin lyase
LRWDIIRNEEGDRDMHRRSFLALAAAASATANVSLRKAGKVETVFRSPGEQPNGLQATREGLWVMDQNDNKAYLVNYADGSLVRSFLTEADRASGITYDGEALWLASTYSRELIRCDAATGKTIAKYFTPGAGVIYRMAGDAGPRSSPLARREPRERPAGEAKTAAARRPALPDPKAPGTGGHGLEWRDGKLWVAVPPSRSIYRFDPETWTVEKKFATAGNRPHGIGWEGRFLWCADSNMNAFHKHDPETGAILERIQLEDSDPLPHGMTVHDGWMWYCDDVGVVCRLRIA